MLKGISSQRLVERLQGCGCLLVVVRIHAFRHARMHRFQHRFGLRGAAAMIEESREAACGTQFPGAPCMRD